MGKSDKTKQARPELETVDEKLQQEVLEKYSKEENTARRRRSWPC